MLDVFGLDPAGAELADRGAGNELTAVVDGLVAELLNQREAARERKDLAAADAIRDTLDRARRR